MKMMVLHISKRKIIGMAAIIAAAAVASVLLAGCFADKEKSITLADTAAMAQYLRTLGWQVEDTPIETLDLQLPQVRRFTFRVTNYPAVEKGVQANLYLCGDTLIGGDIVATGKGGFQHGLAFPAA